MKEECERASFRLNIRKKKNLRSWHLESICIANGRGKVEVVTNFLLVGSKIPADGDYIHEIRRQLLLGRKAMTNLVSVLKIRDIILLTKVHIVKAMVFPVIM